ncbi:MAG: DUF3995 domain-containing protein [Pseudomonadota bacterium]
MQMLAICVSSILVAIAFAHALWGLRIWWPVRDELALARTVVGAPRIDRMPSCSACLTVTLALLVVSVLNLVLGGVISTPWLPDTLVAIAGYGAAVVFLLRGFVGYLPFWARITPEQPFRTYDKWAYSPLCILLGLGILALAQSFRASGFLV